jgi:sugar phosphate isomerase/epimerase
MTLDPNGSCNEPPSPPQPAHPLDSTAPPVPPGGVSLGGRGGVRATMRGTMNNSGRTRAIQCSTGPFWAYELEAAFDAIAESGFAAIELMVSRDPSTHEPGVPLRLAAERGLVIASVHGPFLAVTKAVWGTNPLHKITRGIQMCRALGADVLIVHPPLLWERQYARWCRDEVARAVEESGITVAMETMYPRWIRRRPVSLYQWTEPHVLRDMAPRVALDTSHVTVARRDVIETFEMLRSKLVHVHVSDNAGDGRDGHLELGAGVVPLDGLLSEMRRTHYSGAISLEISVRRYLGQQGALVEALRRNRRYVERRLARSAGSEEGSSRI